MLGFFPTPYPDELFYGTLARYHVYSGNRYTYNSIIDLFGKNVMINVWWQGNIFFLVNRLPVLCFLDEETIINRQTLLPLFSLFMERNRGTLMRQASINENGEKALLRSLVGIQGLVDRNLFYCPICVANDKHQYNEAYWHRVHQIPGVFVCPEHETQLKQYVLDKSKQVVPLRDINWIDINNVPNKQEQISDNLKEVLVEIAKDFKYLLITDLKHIDVEILNKIYRYKLIQKNLASIFGSINRKRFIQEFEDYYGTEVLKYLEFNYKNLLSRFLQKSKRTFSPLCHVLIMRFLAGSVESFIETNMHSPLFGSGPWYCLNPAAAHYKELCVKDISVGYSEFTKKPLAVLSCELCGFKYSYLGVPDSEEKEQVFHRVVEFGPVWENQLKILIQKEVSLKQISSILGVQPRKVKQKAESLGISTDWKLCKGQNCETRFDEKRRKYRKEWLEIKSANNQLSRSELYKLNSRLSSWLIRNDFDWYEDNVPQTNQQYRKEQKRCWSYRDEELFREVKRIIDAWNDRDKPIRITKSRIFDLVGKSYLRYSQLDKLHRTNTYIESVIESIEDFQIRKVKWAIATLKKEDKFLTESLVLDKIHLLGKHDISRRVLEAIKVGIKHADFF
ncbi:TnsD family Tn7-like transposition protein [Cytobacillus sp. FSL R5-0596]|uniref:TnsD family Tn7-like transposition protein n=1 Tax=Cytobacillus sp. FSL R5-0596 TaxID=2954696 RepID=UPI0030F7F3E6